MPPKTTFTKKDILNAGFSLVKKKGLTFLTVRNVATKLGSSTAPVYSHYASIAELEQEVFSKAMQIVLEYSKRKYTNINFLNVGVGITMFAREYPILYRSLFMELNNHAEDLVEFDRELMKDLSKEPYIETLSDSAREAILTKVAIFVHGLCAMISVDNLKYLPYNSQEEIVKLLYDVGNAIILDAINPPKPATMTANDQGGYDFEC